jgi:predicted HTH domain antitoxin
MKLEIDLDIPDGVLDEAVEKAIRVDAILRLFAERKISSALACGLLAMPRVQFMRLTEERGIPHYDYTSADLASDLTDLNRIEASRPAPPDRDA